MAISPSHKLGQAIGNEFESAIREPLSEVAKEYGLYLDYPHPRTARNRRKTVSWKDLKGNSHRLDYVLEEDGSETKVGIPRAFIEIAWRRYTKHSKNKAQEIQGAVTPLFETYVNSHPFLGAILAGEFTQPAQEQFRSHGFEILHCPYETIIKAFSNAGIDVSTQECTSVEKLQAKVDAVEQLTSEKKEEIRNGIRELHKTSFEKFFSSLRSSLSRKIERVSVLPLTGVASSFGSIEEAILFVSALDEQAWYQEFVRYEINIRYNNGDDIKGNFQQREDAIKFLQIYVG